ncbi:RagB/SusD family nutrient uptake outer membrane protein [Sphingobacterium psychroaquaticum]|nr:RagB/SusD family nutrient uptake outer membrane protein [Sphingobacterium psychroaquaticum]
MKIIYKIQYSIASLLLVACLLSCDKSLDKPVPDTSIPLEKVQPGDLPLLLRGAYRPLGIYYQPYPVWDIYSDDITSIQGSSPAQFNPRSYDDCNPNVQDGFGNGRLYNSAYTAIGNANFIINYIRTKGLTDYNSILGEALTIRAYNYYRLAEAYGGVILTLDLETDISVIRRDKNTEEEVYAHITKDLTDAIPLLGDFKSADNVSKPAAQLLLARTYLHLGKNKEAYDLSEEVIKSGKNKLSEGDFGDNFRYASKSSEMLWRLSEPITGYERGGLYTMYSPPPPFRGAGIGLTWVDPTLAQSYEPGDIRASLLLKRHNNTIGEAVTYLLKFSTDTLQPSSNAFIVYPIARISEAYLISAEAAARQGQVVVTRYNELRKARGSSQKLATAFANTTAFLAEIEAERRRELVGEGRRWQDMKRFGKAIPYLQSKGQDATRLFLPFNSTELLRNIKLSQNKGY